MTAPHVTAWLPLGSTRNPNDLLSALFAPPPYNKIVAPMVLSSTVTGWLLQ